MNDNLSKVYAKSAKSEQDYREYPEVLREAVSIARRMQVIFLEMLFLGCGALWEASTDIFCYFCLPPRHTVAIYLDICISRKIRLCVVDLEGKFQTNLQVKLINFLVSKSIILIFFFWGTPAMFIQFLR